MLRARIRPMSLATGLLAAAAAHAQTPASQAPAPPAAADLASLAGPFEYDRKIPLDPQDAVVAEREGCAIHDVTYPSPRSAVSRRTRSCRRARPRPEARYASQRRGRCGASASTLSATFTSSTTWKSYIPTQMKSAPLRKAKRKPWAGSIAPAASTL